MELLEISHKIEEKNLELDDFKKSLVELAKNKVFSASEYEKVVALTLISLRNGKSYEFEGQTIENPPTTIMEKIVKGICWRESLAKDSADAKYNNIIKKIDIVKAQLNGYQSIYKHLSAI